MTFKTTATALALVLAFTSAAQAELSTAYGHFSANLGLVNDYRFRGLSQNDEGPAALQGGIDWFHDSGPYAGIWASTIDIPTAHIETDIYGGYKINISGLGFDAGLIGYLYPDADSNRNYDYFEGKLAMSYDAGFAVFGTGLYYSPDYFGSSGDALYWSMNGKVPISSTGFAVIGSFGHQSIDDNIAFGSDDYYDWSLGVSYGWNGFDFTAKYVDTDLDDRTCNGGNDGCDATGVFSVSKVF